MPFTAAGLRRADFEQAARRPGPEQGDRRTSATATATASRIKYQVRRRSDGQRSSADGPPPGRGRRTRASRCPTAAGTATARTSTWFAITAASSIRRLSALIEDLERSRHAGRRDGHRLGRVRPHAAHQQGRRPRSLAAGELCAAGRRRHAHRAGHRRHQPPRRTRRASVRSISRRSSPRCTTTSASTRKRPRSAIPRAGRNTWSNGRLIQELVG